MNLLRWWGIEQCSCSKISSVFFNGEKKKSSRMCILFIYLDRKFKLLVPIQPCFTAVWWRDPREALQVCPRVGKFRAATDVWNETAKTSGSWFSGANNSTGPRSVSEKFRLVHKIPLDLDDYIFSFALLQGFVDMAESNVCCEIHLLSDWLCKALTQGVLGTQVKVSDIQGKLWGFSLKKMYNIHFRQERN